MYITFEHIEEKGFKDSNEHIEFINHSRVYVNEDQEIIVYYEDDNHDFVRQLTFKTDLVEDLESAGYYMSIANFVPYNNISVAYTPIVKELLESEYLKNEKPSFDIKEWIEVRIEKIAIIYLETIIEGIRNKQLKVSL